MLLSRQGLFFCLIVSISLISFTESVTAQSENDNPIPYPYGNPPIQTFYPIMIIVAIIGVVSYFVWHFLGRQKKKV